MVRGRRKEERLGFLDWVGKEESSANVQYVCVFIDGDGNIFKLIFIFVFFAFVLGFLFFALFGCTVSFVSSV